MHIICTDDNCLIPIPNQLVWEQDRKPHYEYDVTAQLFWARPSQRLHRLNESGEGRDGG